MSEAEMTDEEAGMSTDGDRFRRDVPRMAAPYRARPTPLREVSTLELVSRITRTASRLAKREIELATVEARADLVSTVAMGKWLAVAAVAAIAGITMLPVALAFALTEWLPGWAAALIVAAVVLAVAVAVGMSGWRRRVKTPLARTRESVKEDLEWVKQRIA